MELTVDGATYRTGKLDAITQFQVGRRLLPIISSLGAGFSALALTEGGEAARALTDSDMLTALGPAAQALASMSDKDTEYVLRACLGGCHRQQASGWAPVQSPSGKLMFDDLSMRGMMKLVIATIQENQLVDFLPGVDPV